jgi:peptidoglycan hydrolase-like protein with peptidoglycan-binding domain
MKPTETSSANVHRSLHLSTPLMHGRDVRALQEALEAEFKHYKIDWLPVNPDGKFGPQTLHAARFFSWVIGLGGRHRKAIKKGNLAEATQHLLRNPEQRSRVERRRAKRRSTRLEKIRKAQSEGPAFAVAGARACIGITESPAGSNTGPDRTIVVQGRKFTVGVSAFERYWGLGACYWCLCFACFWVKQAGGRISGNCAYSVAIEGYARNHENGFIQVPLGDRRAGDLTIWKFAGPSALSDHGELVAALPEDIAGNTSSDSGGSQSNGGGVFSKDVPGPARSEAQLSMVVRPLYS